MSAVTHAETTDVVGLVHQILSEGGRAARLMGMSGRHKTEMVIVLRSGDKPSIWNLLRRHKAEVFRLSNKGHFLLDKQTGQPYVRCWTATAYHCVVPVDLEATEHHRLEKLLRRIRRLIHECQ